MNQIAEEEFIQAGRQYARKVYEIGKSSGFYDVPHTDPLFNHSEKMMLVVTELSEAVEGLRGAPFPGIPDTHLTNRPMVEAELADVVIRVMNYASHCGLDLFGAIVEKAAFNATRSRRHGGKRF